MRKKKKLTRKHKELLSYIQSNEPIHINKLLSRKKEYEAHYNDLLIMNKVEKSESDDTVATVKTEDSNEAQEN